MAASDLEFRYRFWIFGALFCIAFASYSIDHQNTGDVIVQWIARVRGTTARAGNYRAIHGNIYLNEKRVDIVLDESPGTDQK